MNRLTFKNHQACRVISVLSGKGGVGKSVIAFNLAHQLAEGGARILLVDGDQSCGNLHILAGVHPKVGVLQYRSGLLSLAESVSPFADDFDLLAQTTNSPSDDAAVIATAEFVGALRRDSASYDAIIIDYSSGISQSATVMAHGSDLAVLVLVPELTSIADVYGLYKYLIQANRNLECRLLINRCESIDEARYIRNKLFAATDRFLGRMPGFAGWLPEDAAVRKSVAIQRPVSAVNSGSPFVQGLNNIARVVLRATPGADEPIHLQINNHPATADKGN